MLANISLYAAKNGHRQGRGIIRDHTLPSVSVASTSRKASLAVSCAVGCARGHEQAFHADRGDNDCFLACGEKFNDKRQALLRVVWLRYSRRRELSPLAPGGDCYFMSTIFV